MSQWSHIIQRLPRQTDAWLVGGCVRDLCLQRTPKDIDIAVAADTAEFAQRVTKSLRGRLVEIRSRKGFRLLRVISKAMSVDVMPLVGNDIAADLLRRDFSINAMAIALSSGRLIDPHGGRSDLQHRTIRAHWPEALRADPVRMLRAFRIGAQLEFEVCEDTLAAVADQADRIQSCAAERVSAELLRLFKQPNAYPYLRSMAQRQLLAQLLPELNALKADWGPRQYHPQDSWTHSLKTFFHLEQILNRCPERLGALSSRIDVCIDAHAAAVLKFSALLHDIGKATTRRTDSTGQVHYFGHAAVSADMVAKVGQRLRLSRQDVLRMQHIVRHHLRPLLLFDLKMQRNLSQRAVTRFFKNCGDNSPAVLLHALADQAAKTQTPCGFTGFIEGLLHEYFKSYRVRSQERPLITGRDLIDHFGLSPSPLFAEILALIEEGRLTRHLRSRNDALAAVKTFLQKRHDQVGNTARKKK